MDICIRNDVISDFSKFQFQVLHGDVRHRGDPEAGSDEPQVLLSRGLEHLRLHHRRSFAPGTGFGRRARSVGITILQIGEYALRVTTRRPLQFRHLVDESVA